MKKKKNDVSEGETSLWKLDIRRGGSQTKMLTRRIRENGWRVPARPFHVRVYMPLCGCACA